MRELLHYKIVERLGEGAMGEVFRAIDQKLGREVALKLLPDDVAAERTSQARLVREARAASALNHPGIVTLHDIELADGKAFIVMELVQGERFSDLARRGVSWRRALELVASVGEAMAFAHAREVLHRDIKADNLMVTASGQTKVLDFGLAKLREQAGLPPTPVIVTDDLAIAATARSGETKAPASPTGSDITQAGQLVGTPAYMAPECFEGKADARSEVFALGIVLYEMLCGKRPFDRETATATMIAIQLDDAEPPSKVAPDRAIPERIDAIVMRAIAKKPEERYADMPAFVAALREELRVRTRRWPWIAAGIAGLGAASGITYALLDRDDPITIEIGASRRITFDPGCEEYPRLHPDGKRIVHDGVIDGDYEIQIRDLDGSNRRRITTTPGWDYASAISPDGVHVAYVHEHPGGRTLRLAVIDTPSEPRDLGAIVGYPAWSHDGALLVGDANGQIIKRTIGSPARPGSPAGHDGNQTVLGRLPAGARLYHLLEGDDGRLALLWWTSSEADASALGELVNGELRVVEQATIDYEGGLAAGRRGYYATRKAVTEGNQLLFRAWGNSKPTVVGGGLSPGAGIDVAPDGKRLVFSTCLERQYIARIVGGKPEVISQGTWQDTNPRVVDDKRIVVTSDRTGTMQGWMLDAGGSPKPVTPPRALGASPSPDGKRIVYAADGGRGGLAIVEGGEPRVLTREFSDTSPAFTHDGAHVVFERTNARGATEIHVVPASGGESRLLAEGAQPSASPAGDAIVFLTAADDIGARRVMRTDLAGTPPVLVDSLEPAAWQRPRFSHDGKRLVVVRGYQQIVTTDGTTSTIEWTSSTGSVSTADFARDGSIIAALGDYDGDLWIAEGEFP